MKDKRVTSSYFRVWVNRPDGTQQFFNLGNVFELLEEKSSVERTYKIQREDDFKVRFQVLNYKEPIWEIRILKLRDNNLEKANDHGDCEVLQLEDGEYLAESCSALYDTETGIFVIHRNSRSLAPSGFVKLLNKEFKKNKEDIFLMTPIQLERNGYRKVKNTNEFTKMEFAIDYEKSTFEEGSGDKKGLFKILDALGKEMGNTKAKIILSVDARSSNRLNDRNMRKNIDLLYQDERVSNLKISFKEDENTSVETVDLCKDFLFDEFSVKVDEQNILAHGRVFFEMKRSYLERKEKGELNKFMDVRK